MALIIGSNPVGVIQNFLPTATNLLEYSQLFTNAYWTATNLTVTASAIAAPDGTMTALQLADTLAGGDLVSTAQVSASTTYTFSLYVATTAGTVNGSIVIYDSTSSTTIATQNFTATTTWQRITVSTSVFSSGDNIEAIIYPGRVAGSGTIQAWGAQLEATSYATPYITTVAAPVTVTSNADGSAPSESTASLANPGRKEYAASIHGGLFTFPENIYNKDITLVGYEFALGGQTTWSLAVTDGLTNLVAGDTVIASGTTQTTIIAPDIPGLVLFPGQQLRLVTTGTASHNFWRCTVKVAYTLSEGLLWI